VLGKILSTLSILLVLIFSSVKAYRLKKSDLAFGLILATGLIISPASLDYHYIIILLSVFIIMKWIIANPDSIVWTVLAASVILMAAYIPYTSAKVTGGWLSLFAYPKLYGAVVLWGLFLFAAEKNYTSNVRKEN
jgi:hypothetical protein